MKCLIFKKKKKKRGFSGSRELSLPKPWLHLFLKDDPQCKDAISQYMACYCEGGTVFKDSYPALIRKKAPGNDSASPWQTDTTAGDPLPSVFLLICLMCVKKKVVTCCALISCSELRGQNNTKVQEHETQRSPAINYFGGDSAFQRGDFHLNASPFRRVRL